MASAFAANRPVALQGAGNFRDLGGYKTSDGRALRPGLLYRSDALCGLPGDDVQAIRALGVRTVIDLRSNYEEERARNSFAGLPGVTYRLIPFAGDRPENLYALYLQVTDRMGQQIAEALRLLLRAPLAAVFHCSAGKDRTGVLAALVLSCCGVPRAQIVADYAATWTYMEKRYDALLAAAAAKGEAVPAEMMYSLPQTMDDLLNHLDEHYGGVAAYLASAGFSGAEQLALRGRLVA